MEQLDLEGKEGMEYEFDDEAEQVQGKLATERVEEQKMKIQGEDEDDKMQIDDEQSQNDGQDQNEEEQQIQQTQQTLKNLNVKEAVEEGLEENDGQR